MFAFESVILYAAVSVCIAGFVFKMCETVVDKYKKVSKPVKLRKFSFLFLFYFRLLCLF